MLGQRKEGCQNSFKQTNYKKMAKIRNRYNQVLRLSQDTTVKSDKNTIEHHKGEPINFVQT